MTDLNQVTIIIPCYNESLCIPYFRRWLSHFIQALLQRDASACSVLLVENGSTDNTMLLLSEINDPHVQILQLPDNRNYGGGIQAGIMSVASSPLPKQSRLVAWLPSDCQYPAEDCADVIAKAVRNHEPNVVTLTRRAERTDALSTQIISTVYLLINSLLDPLLAGKDINSLPKILPTAIAANLIQNYDLPLDFFFDLAIYKILVRSSVLKRRTYNIRFQERPAGASSWRRSDTKKLIRFFRKTIQSHFLFNGKAYSAESVTLSQTKVS